MTLLPFSELLSRLHSVDEATNIEAKLAEKALGKSALETFCAFANEPGLKGGYVVFGVRLASDTLFPVYEVAGVENAGALQDSVISVCRDAFSAQIRPLLQIERYQGKHVLVVFIPEAAPHEKPVFINASGIQHGAYRRIGATDQRCNEDDLAALFQQRDHKTFDETVLTDADFDDLDPKAILEYRRLRGALDPTAAELAVDDAALLRAVKAVEKTPDGLRPTLAGILAFGTELAHRRLFPMVRVDYIIVEGKEWVPTSDRRFASVELRGALIFLIPKLISLIINDLPQAFSLPRNADHRRDLPLIPREVIREAVVNAVMHRSYRLRQPVQVIRYSNRIEIRNPGHSLVALDVIEEPGSLSRNEKVAAILKDVKLAETKGSGIRVMQAAMNDANLSLPLFESNRTRESFMVTLLVHHLLSEADLGWLSRLGISNNDEAKALVVVRELGRITNADYRAINRVDVLEASKHLRRLREARLLDHEGKGSASSYVPSTLLLRSWERSLGDKPLTPRHGLGVRGEATVKPAPEGRALRAVSSRRMTSELQGRIRELGYRATLESARSIVLDLCSWRPMSVSNLAFLLGRTDTHIRREYLRPLLRQGLLRRALGFQPSSPLQRYYVEGTAAEERVRRLERRRGRRSA